jgi:DDE superfamily endonuclease
MVAGVPVAAQPLEAWLRPFATALGEATRRRALVLVAGALLAPGRRTVASALRAAGLEGTPGFAGYHRVLSHARWCALAAAERLLALLVAAFVPDGPVVVALDDTLERRWGRRIRARGIYRDPVRSSRGHFVKASGLRWLSLMLVVPVPWAGRAWALPFLTVLAPSERSARERGGRHKRLTDWARQVLLQAARWLPGRRVVAVADSGFAGLELLDAVRRRVAVVTRLRLDARLFDPPPPRTPRTIGRPRVVGERLPTLARRLADRRTRWRRLAVAGWYGGGDRVVEVCSGTALWHHPGMPVVPLRWVLVRDPLGEFRPQAFLCTDLDAEPAEILSWFVRRWATEVTFAEARRHLGMETQRQWSDRAVARTTPALLGLHSLVTLWADELHRRSAILPRAAAWYAKPAPTFSDALAAVRRTLWADAASRTSRADANAAKVPRAVLDRLTDLACYAA